MADIYVDLALASGLNDGTSWANAYQNNAGLASAWTAANHAAGDDIWVKGTSSSGASVNVAAIATIAACTNPPRTMGVKAATTNEPPVQSDLVPGLRTGNATRAYDQTSGNAAPILAITGGSDFGFRGCMYVYGLVVTSQDNIEIINAAVESNMIWEECALSTDGSTDVVNIGSEANGSAGQKVSMLRCKLGAATTGGIFRFRGPVKVKLEDCDLDLENSGGAIEMFKFEGMAKISSCDLSGCTSPIVDIATADGGTLEFFNCTMPASHVLVTGTATGQYHVANYGSEDSTGLTTSGSEQALQIYTHIGTVDLETTVVRTGGATDGAAGLFAYAVGADNVTDNFIGVEVPLADIWVAGDGTSNTYTVFIANSTASTDFQDDEVYLRLEFPSEAGISRYDFRPDDGAPGDGGGRMQLLGTPANLTDDTGSTWGTGGNNHQTLSQSIAPDYEGYVYGTLIYSRSGADTLYVDPRPVIT